MKNAFKGFSFGFALLAILWSVIGWAQAQVPPETVEQVSKYLPQFVEAILAGDWKVVGGIGMMIAVVAARQFGLPKWKIEADHLPFIIGGFSAIAFAGLSLLTPNVGLLEALGNGLVTAIISNGLWDLFGEYIAKLLLGDKFKSPEPKLLVLGKR